MIAHPCDKKQVRRKDGALAGTPIHTDRGDVPIEKVEVGDKVISRDSATGKLENMPVTALIAPHKAPLLEMRIEGERTPLRPSTGHSFWVKRGDTGEKWIEAGSMHVGDQLQTLEGAWRRVVSITPVVGQEGRPSLCRLRTTRSFPHPAQHRSLRNLEAQHLKFATNPRRTPGWILGDHGEDKFTQFFADALSFHAIPAPREPRPIQLESCLVPAHDGLWMDENQCPLPSRPKPPQDDPKQFVRSGKPRLRMFLFQNDELLPKRQVLQQKIMSRSEGMNKQGKQKLQRTEHTLVCWLLAKPLPLNESPELGR